MNRKTLSATVAFLSGILLTLVFLELVLRMLPVGRGAYAAEPDPAWPAHHLVPNSSYTFSSGWDLEDVQHGHINNMGYVSPFDYSRGTGGVFVVGDSFIEDQMTRYDESLQGALPSLLKRPMPVLGFGTSGGNLAHDLGVATLIGQQFKPTWAVVVVTRRNFVNGFVTQGGYYQWTSGDEPGIGRAPDARHGLLVDSMRHLALLAYMRGNLEADRSTLFAAKKWQQANVCHGGVLSRSDEALVRFSAQQLPIRFKLDPSHVVLVLDTDRAAIYNPPSVPCPSRDDLALALLGREAAAAGIQVVDMDPVFREAYRLTGRRFDYLPVDGHWNPSAHALAAQQVARIINGATP
ncbi:MAG TPA: hypothetical protein VNZ06_10310 [Steroidobacteraceae bacterium]|jgi:hypothetical protein|nr:hypothetical protein [Steroidobacteraceae bacterium]